MDDLKDLNWQVLASNPATNNGQTTSRPMNVNYNPIFQRQNNPFSHQNSVATRSSVNNSITNSSSASSANEVSFGGLVNFGSKKPEKMTMAQQAGRYGTTTMLA